MAGASHCFAARQWLSARPDAAAILVGASPVEVRPAGDGRGQGLFTTRALPAFTEILSEAPAILLRPTDDLPQLYEQYIALREPGSDAVQMKYMALSYHDLPERDARLREKLAERGFDTGSADEMVRVASIMQNNAFNVDLGHGTGENHRALFLDVARINHSCAPNAHVCFYQPERPDGRGRMVIHSLRDLQANEEVLIAYFSILLPTTDRQDKASKWGFRCLCSACQPQDAAHEHQRKAITDFTAKQAALMHDARPTMKQITDLIAAGTKLIGKVDAYGRLRPAIPDLYDNIAMLRAKGLLVQRKEKQREGVLEFLEQATIYEAKLTGVGSPATKRRLHKLEQFAAQKDAAGSAKLVTSENNVYSVAWT
ncbi:hypothetical protein CB0940_00760 [Cercospora beticola]|uniref:SET domain-containing protein n=1 Tax=Cercospora beticola TaxID=122368 RepID=A0A2G5IBE1_CERBT|nr:hypothetical protein CB0940_00760 [Cercospora beticola]PIB02022.1 hypothetical protein CB0940_00760 [Cercospora beticola]WPA96188.1 hypothetical protein RHO25_000794 [Cercospora beticola]CAK1355525.1 unnamed protein product [Cercospora beticola]